MAMGGTVAEFADYLKENELSENTIACYCTSVEKFFSMFDKVSKENTMAYKRKMIDSYSPKTAANRCIALNRYCEFIGRQDCKVKTVKTPKKLSVENVISEDEYNYFLRCLEQDGNWKVYWLVQFLAKTGARVSEIVQLEKKHLKAGEAQIWTKGKIRRILIPAALIEQSAPFFANQKGQLLFPNFQGKQMTTRGVAGMIKRSGEKYGIRSEVLHPHAFRHFYAIQFLKRNNNITLLADLMGHESIETTAIYLRLSADEQREQFQKAMDW